MTVARVLARMIFELVDLLLRALDGKEVAPDTVAQAWEQNRTALEKAGADQAAKDKFADGS